jgi:predicted TPR repeat methyltransferase
MLAQARTKDIYDRLVENDVLAFLAGEAKINARYHLVLAADVFMYFDDLAPVLNAVAPVLAEPAQVVFSAEAHDGHGVHMRDTLRYAHSKEHVKSAVLAAGLKPISLDFASTRTEKGEPVPGLIVVAGH